MPIYISTLPARETTQQAHTFQFHDGSKIDYTYRSIIYIRSIIDCNSQITYISYLRRIIYLTQYTTAWTKGDGLAPCWYQRFNLQVMG